MTAPLSAELPIVVTGADGFIGTRLVERLRGVGAQVVALDASPRMPTTIKADICDPGIGQLIPPGSVVIHLAALSTDGACRQDPELAVKVNLLGTLNLARASKDKQADQFIFASSEWVYGDSGGEAVQDEETPIDVVRLTSIYAVTKAAAEPMLRSVMAPDNVTILRFGIVYGPRASSWSAVERLLFDVSQNATVEVGSARTGRRFIFVDDLVEGIVASIGQRGALTLNISGDALVTIGDLIAESSILLGKDPDVRQTSPDNWVQRNPSNAAAVSALSWSPRFDIATGLRAVADFLELDREEAQTTHKDA